jgi:hypothetical protein
MQNHYEKLYADIIFPAIYGTEYEEPVQLTIDDIDSEDTLATDDDTDIIDKASEYNQERTRFQKGNDKGIRFAKEENPDDSQLELDLESSENPTDIL